MTPTKQFAALLGFLFAAAWIAFGFGDAVLCLLGAGLFYAAASFYQGDLDMADVQARLGSSGPGQTGGPAGQPRAAGARPRVR